MLGAIVAEVVLGKRCVTHDLAAVVVLAVEAAQRVDLRALEAVLAHLISVVKNELTDLLAIGGTARRITHRVDGELQAREVEAKSLVVLHEHDDALGVRCRIRGAQPLDAHLVELAQTALLGSLATEHGLGVPKLCGRGTLGHHVVLHGSAHHAGRPLGTHGQALLGLEPRLRTLLEQVLEERTGDHTEHLLAHDIRGLTNAVDKGVYLLDCGSLDHVKAVCTKEVTRHILHVLPGAHVAAKEVLGSLNPLCHVMLLPRRSGASGRGHERRVHAPPSATMLGLQV